MLIENSGRSTPAAPLEPGKVYEYTIDLWRPAVRPAWPSHPPGSVEQQLPRFDRNLNTGEEPFTSTRMRKAQQVVHHSKQDPSHVVLPIIPRERP